MKREDLSIVDARDLADERLVADLIAVAADHRRDLRVEERPRDDVGRRREDLEILARGVEHLDDAGRAKELVERLERQPLGQRIDEHGACSAPVAGPGDLHEAQLRVVGPLAQELGVDGDVRAHRAARAEPRERVGIGDGVIRAVSAAARLPATPR